MTYFFLIPLLLLGSSPSMPVPPGDYCLPQRYLTLAGIRLDMPEDSVIGRLGRPSRTTSAQVEDDGGEFETTTLHYLNLDVQLGRDRRVMRLFTASAKASMEGGIRIGQTMEEVTGRLRAPADLDELEEVTWTPVVCEDGLFDPIGNTGATFTWTAAPGPFDVQRAWNQRRALARIELFHEGP